MESSDWSNRKLFSEEAAPLLQKSPGSGSVERHGAVRGISWPINPIVAGLGTPLRRLAHHAVKGVRAEARGPRLRPSHAVYRRGGPELWLCVVAWPEAVADLR